MSNKQNRFQILKLEERIAPKITAVTTTTQENGGGNTPKGEANGVPIVVTTVNENPSGHEPPGHN